MDNSTERSGPASPEERQAAVTVASAQTVVAEIDALRRRLGEEGLSPQRRRQAKQDLSDASDRLCNLMALALYQLSSGAHGKFQDRMQATLDQLRHRLLEMGTRAMLEKVELIHDRVAEVLAGEEYPLGLASRLESSFSSVVGNMSTLGADSRLTEEERQLVEATRRDLDTLAAIEKRLGVLEEIGQPKA